MGECTFDSTIAQDWAPSKTATHTQDAIPANLPTLRGRAQEWSAHVSIDTTVSIALQWDKNIFWEREPRMEQMKVIINQRICLFTHTLSQEQTRRRPLRERKQKQNHTCAFFRGFLPRKNAFFVLPLLAHIEHGKQSMPRREQVR